jgi:ketosteroid isomerase-like protein
MRTIRVLCGVVLLAASNAPCLFAQTKADSASVNAFYSRWFGSATHAAATYARFYAPDGYILPPGSPPVVGPEAIAAWFERTEEALPYVARPDDFKVDEIRFLSSEWVVYRSTQHGQRFPKAGGDPVPFATKYVDLLHRTGKRGWEVVLRMWNDNR